MLIWQQFDKNIKSSLFYAIPIETPTIPPLMSVSRPCRKSMASSATLKSMQNRYHDGILHHLSFTLRLTNNIFSATAAIFFSSLAAGERYTTAQALLKTPRTFLASNLTISMPFIARCSFLLRQTPLMTLPPRLKAALKNEATF